MGQKDMENIIRKRRVRWLGDVWRMDKDRRVNQILHWVPEGRMRRGRPRKNRAEAIKNDLRGLEISSERAEELVIDRVRWRRCIARCADIHRMEYGLRFLEQKFPNFFDWRLPCYIQIFLRLTVSNFKNCTLRNSDSQ